MRLSVAGMVAGEVNIPRHVEPGADIPKMHYASTATQRQHPSVGINKTYLEGEGRSSGRVKNIRSGRSYRTRSKEMRVWQGLLF